MNTLFHGDCVEVMKTLDANSIDLILTDPPYHKVKKKEAWDNEHKTIASFIAWLGKVADEWQRILKPNGSVYVFASPQMAWYVEGMMRERFSVLNHVIWNKSGGTRANQADKDILRQFFGNSERIIFAEHFGADNIAKGEAGYIAKCDELRGFIFEPIRAYLDGERKRAGVPHRVVISDLGMTGHDSHFFSKVQWKLPLPEQYEKMREIFSKRNHGGSYLRTEYEDLRTEYEDLRSPFNATPDAPYTDVWTFATVSHYKGKHPCEKPAALLEHAINISTRPGATVLDCFMGGGSTGSACDITGRNFIGIEKDDKYFHMAKQRLERPQTQTLFAEVSA